MRSMDIFRDVLLSDVVKAFDTDMTGFPMLESVFSAIWRSRLFSGAEDTSISYLARVANRACGRELFIVSCT